MRGITQDIAHLFLLDTDRKVHMQKTGSRFLMTGLLRL